MNKKYKCPCCGYYTFDEKPNGNYDICRVCYWEDDPLAYDNPDEVQCCNRVSLAQARKNFIAFGACEKEMIEHVRVPYNDELQGIDS